MIYELKLQNLPQQKANQDLRLFIESTFDLDDFKLVHAQNESNEKMILLRLKSKEKFDQLNKKEFDFHGLSIEIKNYYRPEIHRINNLLQNVAQKESEGKVIEGLDKISKIYLNNISEGTTEADLRVIFGKFGKIADVEIQHRKDQYKDQNSRKWKKIKFTRASINFERFEDAVNAFYEDKIDISGRFLKIKMYIPKNFSKRIKNLKKKKKKRRESHEKKLDSEQQRGPHIDFYYQQHGAEAHRQHGFEVATPSTRPFSMRIQGNKWNSTNQGYYQQRIREKKYFRKSPKQGFSHALYSSSKHEKIQIKLRKGLVLEYEQRRVDHQIGNLRLNQLPSQPGSELPGSF